MNHTEKFDAWRSHVLSWGLLILVVTLMGCSQKSGRVAVVLDNSGSMAGTGTSFRDIKQSLLNALMMVPASYEKGLRVFDDNQSRLVAPYRTDLDTLRSELPGIRPGGGTYIGESLEDVVRDLSERPSGDHRLIFITDGEGSRSDIEKARNARQHLDQLGEQGGGFKCSFVLFSRRENVMEETPIGQVSEILGCDLTVPGEYASAATLSPTLLRIFGFDFYWILIIISALGYLVLILWSAYLIFDTQVAQKVLPRFARWHSMLFFAALVPLVMGAHLIGLLGWMSKHVWWLVLLDVAILIVAAAGFGKNQKQQKRKDDDPFKDPFA